MRNFKLWENLSWSVSVLLQTEIVLDMGQILYVKFHRATTPKAPKKCDHAKMHVDMFGFQYVSSVCHDCHDCHVAVKLVVIMSKHVETKEAQHFDCFRFCHGHSVISPVGHLPGRCPSRVSLRPPGTQALPSTAKFSQCFTWCIREQFVQFAPSFSKSFSNPMLIQAELIL